MSKSKYPIGPYQSKKDATPRDVASWIDEIENLPDQLEEATMSLSEEQLNTPYRENGWTLRQVVHHIADSHLNGYTRIKLALTEDRPTLKPYFQASWAELPDSSGPIESSLKLIEGLHRRWVSLLKTLDENQLNREIIHPKTGTLKVKSLIGLYAWHGKHHLAHITHFKKHKNWI